MEDGTEDWRVSREDEDPLVKSARREMRVVVGFWLVFALWVVLACWRLGYNGPADPQAMRLVMGMPLWVFWGILVPWLCAMAFTIWFALFFMRDHDLEDHAAVSRGEEEGEGEDSSDG